MNHPIDKTLATFKRWQGKVDSPRDKTLINNQIELLDDINTALSVYGTMRHRISAFEKLISDQWMDDQLAFKELYCSWKEFKESYVREIGSMTVNERLCHMGLMDEFERSNPSPEEMRKVLSTAFLSPEDIEAVMHNVEIQPDGNGSSD